MKWSRHFIGLDQAGKNQPFREFSTIMTTAGSLAAESVLVRSTKLVDGERRFVLYHIDWTGYEKLQEMFGDDGPRMAYLNGTVELMAPDILHEESKHILGRMVVDLVVGLRIPAKGLGSTTFTRQSLGRGLEPDECYYLTNLDRLRGQKKGDLDLLPPPDLVVEVEISSSLLDKLALYRGLGIPEIWRYDAKTLTILLLQADGSYAPSQRSRAFPFLPMLDFVRQLQGYDGGNDTEWTIAYRAWVQEVVAPLYRP